MDKHWWLNYLKGMVKPVAALAVVLLAVMLSYFQKLELEKDMIYSIFRSFIQLSIIGFVLQFIFSQTNIAWILLAYLFMRPLISVSNQAKSVAKPRLRPLRLNLLQSLKPLSQRYFSDQLLSVAKLATDLRLHGDYLLRYQGG
ncbi:Protein ALUMINUM SENSITIVE 3 [Bienertia sinuspersici]